MALERFKQRIGEKSADRSAAPVLIVALGDSVTQGIGTIDELYHDDVYHARFRRRLEAAHPLCTFSVINAGVDGNRVGHGESRLQRDVIRHGPDLVLVAFGLNDAAEGGSAGLSQFESSLRRLCQQIGAQSESDMVLLTPNMMLTRDNDAVPSRWHHVTEQFLNLQQSGLIAEYAQAIQRVGISLSIPVADVYAEWARRSAEGFDVTAQLANGLNHPSREAQGWAAEVLWEAAGI